MEWSKGSALTAEQAIELALSDSDRSHNASGKRARPLRSNAVVGKAR